MEGKRRVFPRAFEIEITARRIPADAERVARMHEALLHLALAHVQFLMAEPTQARNQAHSSTSAA